MTGLLLLRKGRDRLLLGFSLLLVPGGSGGDSGRAVQHGTAVGVDERLAWEIKNKDGRKQVKTSRTHDSFEFG